VLREYRDKMLALWRIPASTDDEGKTCPRLLRFSIEADNLLREFEKRLEPRLGPGGDLEHLDGWGSKLAGGVVRLSGILHLASTVPDEGMEWSGLREPVPAEPVRNAISLAEGYLVPHAMAAFGLIGADVEIEQAKRIVKWIQDKRKSPFKRWEAFLALKTEGLFPQMELLDCPLNRLAAHNYLLA
jgi:hypothetical protein